MPQYGKTWWGERFIAALEKFTNPARLGRGRSYARGGKVKEFHLEKGKITAKVRGSINPYFGVYKEPLYNTGIKIRPISKERWAGLIAAISSNAGMVSKLLLGEMPDNIEDIFAKLDLHLLPAGSKDFETHCSCPDWANPCKHVAGVYYLVAAEFDRDPFLMFELRGLSKAELQKELAKSPLGRALVSQLQEEEIAPEHSPSYFTRPEREAPEGELDIKTFWSGKKRLPASPPVPRVSTPSGQESPVPAILIKKQGDYPAFWDKDVSFIETMEDFYRQVREKNRKRL